MSFTKIDIIIGLRSIHNEEYFEEVERYMEAKTSMIIEEGIKYWHQKNLLEFDRRLHHDKFTMKDGKIEL